jgi:3-deoxy-manno-octulosonate cytidylyltransferase (CMP-KDO synthetase)
VSNRSIAIIVPSRYGSTRFPGKPLHPVAGRSLVRRVWDIASNVEGAAGVWIATDDRRIADHVAAFDGRAVMTPADCATGTDRVFAALQAIDAPVDAVINVQGDAVLTPPWVIQALADALGDPAGPAMVTPAVVLDRARYDQFVAAKQTSPSSGTTVVVDSVMNALYFSKQVLPFIRRPDADPFPTVYRHVGIYGYTRETLERLCALAPSPLERAEGLEQLRALENGIPIRVVPVDYKGRTHWSIDHPDDVTAAEDIIAREGELA